MALRFLVALGSAMLGVTACSGGSGPLVTNSSGQRETPPSTRDVPPGTRDSPNSGCIQCEVMYKCTFPGGFSQQIQLRSADGTCAPAVIDLVCSGAPFNAPGCSGGGGGPFTCGDTTCAPVQTQTVVGLPPTAGSSGFSGSSSSSGGPSDGG
jgi:hypothetical protein